MRLGIWAPLPHTIRPEAEIMIALDELGTHGLGLPQDRSFRFLVDIVLRAEELGFDTTLVAERLVARDLESWVVCVFRRSRPCIPIGSRPPIPI